MTTNDSGPAANEQQPDQATTDSPDSGAATAPTEPAQAPQGDKDSADQTGGDEPLGEGGKKALQAEREARRDLEKQLQQLAPLQKVAEALGGGDAEQGKSEIEQLQERITKHEEQLSSERTARWRAEIAAEKGLTAQQAERLVGSSREELASDADALLALFPPAPSGTPKPDPLQGGRGGSGIDIDSRIKEAQQKGDVRTVISLQNQKLAERAANQ